MFKYFSPYLAHKTKFLQKACVPVEDSAMFAD